MRRVRSILALGFGLALTACHKGDDGGAVAGTGGRSGAGGLFATGGSVGAGGRGTGGSVGAGGGGGSNADAQVDTHAGHDAADPDTRTTMDAVATEVSAETLAIAGGLQGAFLQLDCASPEIELQFCLPEQMGKKSVSFKFGGQPGKKYAVILGVWGVMETVTYKNGQRGGGNLYLGGESGTPKTAEWGLTTSPFPTPQTFFLNHFTMCAGEHYTYGIHYESDPIVIEGGSSMTLFVRDPDNFINTNHMDSQAPDPPAGLVPMLNKIRAMPLMGQFAYVEVIWAQPAP